MATNRPQIDEELSKHLSAEDEMGVVIRAHIHIEANLSEFIDKAIPHPELLSKRMPYESRVRLACSLGFEKEYLDSLKLLGDIRNEFGHKLNARLTDEKVNELYSKLPSMARNGVLVAYEATKNKLEKHDAPAFDKLSAKDRFSLIAVALKMFVVATNINARKLQ